MFFRSRRERQWFGVLVLMFGALIFSAEVARAEPSSRRASFGVKWQPVALVNGSPILFQVTSPQTLRSVSGSWLGHDVFFSLDPRSKAWYGIAAISLETQPGKYVVKLKCETAAGKNIEIEKSVSVRKAKYPKIKASVPKQFTEPSPEQLQQINEERALKKQVFSQSNPEREWSGRFLPPVAAKISDVFGTERTFNGKVESEHQGLDYAVPQGTPVSALNRGTVLLARPLFYEGTCIVLDHGQGLLSLYLHLSQLEVKEGDSVNKGQSIGLSGGSGRATGPHLHVAVRWQGIYLDPATLLSLRLP